MFVSPDLHVQQLLVLYANRCKTLSLAFPETSPHQQRGGIVSDFFFNLIRMGFWPQKTASFSLFNFRSFLKKTGRKLLNFVTCTFILNVATSLAYSNKKVLKSAVKAVAISLTPAGRKERQYALWVKNQFGAHHPLNVVSVPAFSIY